MANERSKKDPKDPVVVQFFEAVTNGNLSRVQNTIQSGLVMPGQLGLLPFNCCSCSSDSDKRSALHWAAAKGHVAIVKFMLENGEDPTLADGGGWTPLMSACSVGHLPVVQLLLAENVSSISSMQVIT